MNRQVNTLLWTITLWGFLSTPLVWSAEPQVPEGDKSADDRYYQDAGGKRGWYWYETTPPQPEKPKAGLPPPAQPPVPPQQNRKENEPKRYPTLQEYPIEKLWTMDPKEFAAVLDGFKARAAVNPTESNVKDFLIVQDVATRKALAFANVASYVVQKNPELSMEKDVPLASPGRTALLKAQSDEIGATLAGAREDFALVYFKKDTCQYCAAQNGILDSFHSRHALPIKVVDVDENPSGAARFNVQTVPTLLLVKGGEDKPFPVSTGVISGGDLERRVWNAVRLMRGDITPEQWDMYENERGGMQDPGSLLR